MAYDATAGNVVLFGGETSSSVIANDTWVWDGNGWTEEHPAASPPGRTYATMAYDAATGTVVLFGGETYVNNVGFEYFNDTWEWNGSTWTEKSPATSPPARYGAAMAYDEATGTVVFFGGLDSSNDMLNDTWVWNGSTWTEASPTTSPSTRYGPSMAYDAAIGKVVLFGGNDHGIALNDTWVWNGSAWTQENPATSPPGRDSAMMAYDAAADTMVLFGGESYNDAGDGIDLNDTWTLSAAAISLSPTSLPAATYGASYSGTIAASGGTLPYKYSVSSGSLPSGLTLNNGSGALGGVPAVTGSFSFTIEATDSIGFTGTENYTLNVKQAASATSVQVSGTSITPAQSVTLTATVVDASPGSTGTPTGTVSFYDNGTLLGAVALSAGVASYSTTSLTPGASNVITASYSGDANFTPSSSTASGGTTIAVAPLDFTFSISGSSTATVNPGQTATYEAAIAPLYGSYPGMVSFTATGLPEGATASMSPSSIPASGGAQTVTVTITATSATSLLDRAPPATPGRRLTPLALAILVLLGAGRLRRRGRMLGRMLSALALLGAGLAVAGLNGCGAVVLRAPASYTVSVTAAAGGVEHSTTISLNVRGT